MINYDRWKPGDNVDGGVGLGDFFTDLKNTASKILGVAKPAQDAVIAIKDMNKPVQTPAVVLGEPTTSPEVTGAAPATVYVEAPAVSPAVWAVGGLGVAALLWALVGKRK